MLFIALLPLIFQLLYLRLPLLSKIFIYFIIPRFSFHFCHCRFIFIFDFSSNCLLRSRLSEKFSVVKEEEGTFLSKWSIKCVLLQGRLGRLGLVNVHFPNLRYQFLLESLCFLKKLKILPIMKLGSVVCSSETNPKHILI